MNHLLLKVSQSKYDALYCLFFQNGHGFGSAMEADEAFLEINVSNAFQFIVTFRWNNLYPNNLKEIWDEISSVQVRFNILFDLIAVTAVTCEL